MSLAFFLTRLYAIVATAFQQALNLKKALLFYLSFLSKGSEVITSIVLASFDWLTSWVDPKNGGQFQGHVWEHFGIPLCDMLVAAVAVIR